jgi:hypothetical protein
MTTSLKAKRSLAVIASLAYLSACAANSHDVSTEKATEGDPHEVEWKNNLDSWINWDELKTELHKKYKKRQHNQHTGSADKDHKKESYVTLTLKLRLKLTTWDDGVSDHPVHCVNEKISTVEIVGITQPRRIGTENCI